MPNALLPLMNADKTNFPNIVPCSILIGVYLRLSAAKIWF